MEINGVYTDGDIEIQVAEITAEETFQKEEFSDDETFIKIEIDTQEEIIPREQNDPENYIFTDEDEFQWKKSLEGKSGGPKKQIPFSCCHCEFIGNDRNELRRHKRDMDSFNSATDRVTIDGISNEKIIFIIKWAEGRRRGRILVLHWFRCRITLRQRNLKGLFSFDIPSLVNQSVMLKTIQGQVFALKLTGHMNPYEKLPRNR